MTATDELHRVLTEAGVEYRFNDATKVFEWHFDGTDGEGSAHATEVDGGINIMACSITPAQAIAATVGRGTCHIKEVASYGYPFECSECKAWYGVDILRGELRFCPNCGAEVVAE